MRFQLQSVCDEALGIDEKGILLALNNNYDLNEQPNGKPLINLDEVFYKIFTIVLQQG